MRRTWRFDAGVVVLSAEAGDDVRMPVEGPGRSRI